MVPTRPMSIDNRGSFVANNRGLLLATGGVLGVVLLVLLYTYSAPKPDTNTATAPTGAAATGKVLQVGALPVT